MPRQYLEIRSAQDLQVIDFYQSQYPAKFFYQPQSPIETQNLLELTSSHYIIGVDEAGRGPVAGPVTAGACLLDLNHLQGGLWASLNDSKTLNEKQRSKLFPLVQEDAIAYGIAEASPTEIDDLNILNATFLAMRRAIAQCLDSMIEQDMKTKPVLILVDGNQTIRQLTQVAQLSIFPEWAQQPVIQGDGLIACISAASILAKVQRDETMIELCAKFPGYELASNKGYPSASHIESIRQLGRSQVHRQSFHIKALDELDLFS